MFLLDLLRQEKISDLMPGAAWPTATQGETAAAVRERLRRGGPSRWELLYVLDTRGRLAGLLTPAELLVLPDEAPVGAHAAPAAARVQPEASQETMATLALDHGVSAVPVVDAAGHPVGIVGSHDLMRILRREHVEDLHRLAGIAQETEQARAALEAPPLRRMRHRLPWLLVGLAGSIVSTGIMGGYEAELGRLPAIAFFVPGLVYLADAIGTQSEAVAVRGLSLTHGPVGRFAWGELRTGTLIGLALALATFLLVWSSYRDMRLAGAVALTLGSSGALAAVLGFSLPWLFDRFGIDPAYGSGPLATIVQQVITLLIYFGFVSWLVAHR